MQSKSFDPMATDNPFFGQTQKAGWARLARVGGDRVSMLLDHLRKRVGVIEGLAEEVTFDSAGRGAGAAYSLGDKPLFVAHELPGALEVSVPLDEPERDSLLASKKISTAMRQAIEAADEEAGRYVVRFSVRSTTDVGSVAKWVVRRSRDTPS